MWNAFGSKVQKLTKIFSKPVHYEFSPTVVYIYIKQLFKKRRYHTAKLSPSILGLHAYRSSTVVYFVAIKIPTVNF